MGAAAKPLHVLGLSSKIETTYNVFTAPSNSTDGFELAYPDKNVAAPMMIDWGFSGELGAAVGALDFQKQVPAGVRSLKGDLPHRCRPGGAAYSSSVIPSIHSMLKICGFDATLDATAAAENYTYTHTAPGPSFASASQYLYTRGERWNAAGMLGSLKLEWDKAAPPIWTFMLQGLIDALPTDVSAPSITYPLLSVQPPLAQGLALTIGNLTSANAVVYGGSLTQSRELTPRESNSSSVGHLGFTPGARHWDLVVELESTALTGSPGTATTTFDPYYLRQNATSFAVALQFGSAQYFRYKAVMAQAQVINVAPSNQGAAGTCKMTIRAYPSTPIANDALSFVFD